MSKVTEILKRGVRLGLYSPRQAERHAKSLRDHNMGYGDSMTTFIVRDSWGRDKAYFRKQNVDMLRLYAENSAWVRAAIDIHRRAISSTKWEIVSYDDKKPKSKRVEKKLRALLTYPNKIGVSYQELKEMWVEDYLVLGHGGIEKRPNQMGEPQALLPMDAARLVFVEDWKGDLTKPRYAVTNRDRRSIERSLPDQMAMVLVNRSRTYDRLGLSHVEVLDKTVRALLEADDYLMNQVLNPAPYGMLDLGKGVTPTQVAQVRSQVENVRRAFIVAGGSEGSKFVNFQANAKQMQALDSSIWFVRQVAAVFGIPTAMLALAVDTSRANTEALLGNAQEGMGALLHKILDCERQSIVLSFGTFEDHNCDLLYPVLNTRDEKQLAEVTKIQTGGIPWMTPNEARRLAGLPRINHPAADELLIPTNSGPIPLSEIDEDYIQMRFGQPDDSAGKGDADPAKDKTPADDEQTDSKPKK